MAEKDRGSPKGSPDKRPTRVLERSIARREMTGDVWKRRSPQGILENTALCGHGLKDLVLQGHHMQAPVTNEVGACKVRTKR